MDIGRVRRHMLAQHGVALTLFARVTEGNETVVVATACSPSKYVTKRWFRAVCLIVSRYGMYRTVSRRDTLINNLRERLTADKCAASESQPLARWPEMTCRRL